VGLGRVKTQRRSVGVEWTFHQVSYLVVETSRACSVAIDFGKLFSSSFDFSSFYTPGSFSEVGQLPGQVRSCLSNGHAATASACRFRAQQETRAPQQFNSYSITSSARASKIGGRVRPRAFADFALMASSKRVGCSMGRSAGLAPLRILSTKAAERLVISTMSGP